MKQKPDEFPDQWVRQTLSQLPDIPPPGSSFDSERLWGKLRPEIEQVPTRRLDGWLWWAAAVCLAGLALGWFWLEQPTTNRTEMIAGGIKHKVDKPIKKTKKSALPSDVSRSVTESTEKPVSNVRKQDYQVEKSVPEELMPIVEPVDAISQMPELPTTVVPPVIEQQTEPRKPTIAISTPKRRFKVVHENELRAEEETRPKLYPNGHFVRIGTDGRTETTAEESRPAFTLPLTHKPNQ